MRTERGCRDHLPRKLTVFDSCFTDPKDAMSLSVKMLFLNGCCLRIGMIMTTQCPDIPRSFQNFIF